MPSHWNQGTCGRTWLALALVTVGAWSCGGDSVPGTDPGDPDPNRAPVAQAGADLTVSAGLPVQLDGSGSSDPDGDAIAYAWTLTTPAGSGATLDDPSSATPAFTPDLAGVYVAQLVVDDGEDDSAPDQVAVTAEDNTTAATVSAADGGMVESSDGLLTLTVPAGALGEDTEIRITRVSAAQIPESAAQLSGVAMVYDLQPSGLTFATPAELRFAAENVFTQTEGRTEASAVLLYSESDGVVEVLTDLTLTPDEGNPSNAVVTGGLDHFSSAFVTRPQGLAFRIDAPASWEAVAEVNPEFDFPLGSLFNGIVSVVTAGSPFPGFTAITQADASVSPVQASPAFDPVLLDEGGGIWTGVNDFICNDAGSGALRADVRVEAADAFESVITVRLARTVACTAAPTPLLADFVPVQIPGAGNFVNTPGLGRVTFGGGSIGVLDPGALSLSRRLGDQFAPNLALWVNQMSDASFLVHEASGKAFWVPSSSDSLALINAPASARDIFQPRPDVTLVATGFGDLGIMDYAPPGGFSDRRLTLQVGGSGPGQQTDDRLIQVWGTDDESVILGARVESDGSASGGTGDAAFYRSDIEIFDASAEGFVPLDGPVSILIDFFDEPFRHALDLECVERADATLLCVFSAGAPNPSFQSPTEGGYLVIFVVDPQVGRADRIRWFIGGGGRVGGSIHPSSDGQAHVVTVVDQVAESIELYRVEGSSVTAETEIPLQGDTLCVAPSDMIYNPAGGGRWIVHCREGQPGEGPGLLVIRNLSASVPGF